MPPGEPAAAPPAADAQGARVDATPRDEARIARTPQRIDTAWQAQAACRNCGAQMDTPHCPQCGQKRAERFSWRDLRQEGWERLRLFEFSYLRTLARLATQPGTVAREYVLGRRKEHAHPLKLLLVLVALTAVMIATNGYFDAHAYSRIADPQLARMSELVRAYGNWSFSLSILAIFIASYSVFHRRLGSNALEHAVLAVYCQCAIVAAFLLVLLPTLVWDAPSFIARYKQVAGNVMYAVRLLVVGVAFTQFFVVDLRRQWPRLLLALLAYAAITWLLLRAFAYAVLKLVQLQMS